MPPGLGVFICGLGVDCWLGDVQGLSECIEKTSNVMAG